MLVLIGATPEGKKELLGFQTGMRESARGSATMPGVRRSRHGFTILFIRAAANWFRSCFDAGSLESIIWSSSSRMARSP